MRLSFILYIILAQFANGFLVDTNMKLESNNKKYISRNKCLTLIGTSLITIASPIKKANAISKCDLKVAVEHNKNVVLNEEILSLEFSLVYQYILIFVLLISISKSFY